MTTEKTDLDHYGGLVDNRAPAQSPSGDMQSDLAQKGWSLVRISRISPEPVVIAYSRKVLGMPEGLAVYTAEELERIAGIGSTHTVHLIHAAKKYGAELMTGGY